jgi:gas vesicle protein
MSRITKTHVAGFFITGAAVGAAVALLYAPKAGTQMRKDIRRISKKAVDQLEKAVDQLDDLQSDIREQVTEGYDKVRRMIKVA